MVWWEDLKFCKKFLWQQAWGQLGIYHFSNSQAHKYWEYRIVKRGGVCEISCCQMFNKWRPGVVSLEECERVLALEVKI